MKRSTEKVADAVFNALQFIWNRSTEAEGKGTSAPNLTSGIQKASGVSTPLTSNAPQRGATLALDPF